MNLRPVTFGVRRANLEPPDGVTRQIPTRKEHWPSPSASTLGGLLAFRRKTNLESLDPSKRPTACSQVFAPAYASGPSLGSDRCARLTLQRPEPIDGLLQSFLRVNFLLPFQELVRKTDIRAAKA